MKLLRWGEGEGGGRREEGDDGLLKMLALQAFTSESELGKNWGGGRQEFAENRIFTQRFKGGERGSEGLQ